MIANRAKIIELLERANRAVPTDNKPNLPPGKNTQGEPEWYVFENNIWMIGEEIRKILIESKSLRRDREISSLILGIATNENAKRGRQSFIMMLGSVNHAEYASKIVTQLSDEFVSGHVIDALTKMKCPNYVKQVEPFSESKKTWVRNKAKRYIGRFKGS